MNSYIIHFTTYTFAMIGFIVLALYVYKKAIIMQKRANIKNFLNIENSLRISASKTIYVLKAGDEKFLIASDPSNTTLLAKLEKNNTVTPTIAGNNLSETELNAIRKLAEKANRG